MNKHIHAVHIIQNLRLLQIVGIVKTVWNFRTLALWQMRAHKCGGGGCSYMSGDIGVAWEEGDGEPWSETIQWMSFEKENEVRSASWQFVDFWGMLIQKYFHEPEALIDPTQANHSMHIDLISYTRCGNYFQWVEFCAEMEILWGQFRHENGWYYASHPLDLIQSNKFFSL